MKKNCPFSGFTLLEILASLAILGVVLGYLLFLREENVALALKTHDGRMARLLARAKVEEILLQGIGKVGSGGTFEKTAGFKWSAVSSTIEPVKNLKMEEIGVTVNYGDQGQYNFILKVWKPSASPSSSSNPFSSGSGS